jgi:tetratricopeptide (TPR) repeat protein
MGRLPRRDVLLIRGSWELSHELHAALATLDTLVREYPTDAEAWYMLGDAYFHIGMLHGIPPESIESALRHAIELDPSFAPAYIHLTEMAFERLDSVEARRLVGAVNQIDSTSPKAIGLGVAWSLAWGDSLQRRHADQLLTSISGDALITAKHALNLAPDLAQATERVAGATAAQGRLSLRHRTQALDGLALSHELRGHLKQDLAIRARLTGLMDSAGFTVNWAPLIPGILRAEGYPVRIEDHPWSPPWPGDHVLWGLWLYGLAASGEGRSDDLKRTFRALRHFAESPRTQGDTTFSLVGIERREAAAYVNALLGFEALRHGDGAAATLHFSQAADSLRPLTTDVTVVDYQLGKLLLAAGHPADAERYMLTSQRWRAGMETELLVPREYYLGQIAEARGNPSVAREHYARFVRWWRDADPELKPWWEDGRRGLARVSTDQGGP